MDLVMAHAGAVSAEYNDLVFLFAPRATHSGPALLQTARFGQVMLDNQFEDGSDGRLYEYELVYFPTTTVDQDLYEIIETTYNDDDLAHWRDQLGALLPGQPFASHHDFMVHRAEWVMNGASVRRCRVGRAARPARGHARDHPRGARRARRGPRS